ncbi:hypothetical protein Tco_1191925 [Tanacetum coccineum]
MSTGGCPEAAEEAFHLMKRLINYHFHQNTPFRRKPPVAILAVANKALSQEPWSWQIFRRMLLDGEEEEVIFRSEKYHMSGLELLLLSGYYLSEPTMKWVRSSLAGYALQEKMKCQHRGEGRLPNWSTVQERILSPDVEVCGSFTSKLCNLGNPHGILWNAHRPKSSGQESNTARLLLAQQCNAVLRKRKKESAILTVKQIQKKDGTVYNQEGAAQLGLGGRIYVSVEKEASRMTMGNSSKGEGDFLILLLHDGDGYRDKSYTVNRKRKKDIENPQQEIPHVRYKREIKMNKD